jgi:hypothetical protein
LGQAFGRAGLGGQSAALAHADQVIGVHRAEPMIQDKTKRPETRTRSNRSLFCEQRPSIHLEVILWITLPDC